MLHTPHTDQNLIRLLNILLSPWKQFHSKFDKFRTKAFKKLSCANAVESFLNICSTFQPLVFLYSSIFFVQFLSGVST